MKNKMNLNIFMKITHKTMMKIERLEFKKLTQKLNDFIWNLTFKVQTIFNFNKNYQISFFIFNSIIIFFNFQF